jgi:hypothetical protein
MTVSPPRAGTRQHPQGAGITLDAFDGNIRNGVTSPVESPRTSELRTPKGFRFNYNAFPRCRNKIIFGPGSTKCPPDSLIGSGTVILDGRPLIPSFIRIGRIAVINATGPSGQPRLYTEAKVFGSTFHSTILLRPPHRSLGPTFVIQGSDDPSAAGVNAITVHLEFPKKVRRGVNLWETPTVCHRSWFFELIDTTYAGQRRVATDTLPCVPASGRER